MGFVNSFRSFVMTAGIMVATSPTTPADFPVETAKKELANILHAVPEKVSLDNIVFVGDSWTLGYTKGLKNAQVVAESGKSSTWVLQNFRNALDKNTEYVVIRCGINNIRSPQQVINDLDSMIRKTNRLNDRKFVVCNLLPRGAPTKTAEERAQIKRNIKKVNDAIKTKWPNNYVDQYSYFDDKQNPGNISPEYVSNTDAMKLHLGSKGNDRAQENILQKIEELEKIKGY